MQVPKISKANTLPKKRAKLGDLTLRGLKANPKATLIQMDGAGSGEVNGSTDQHTESRNIPTLSIHLQQR